MTDICVLATVVGGFNREYRMVVVEDGWRPCGPRSRTPRSTSSAAPTRACMPAKDVADELAAWYGLPTAARCGSVGMTTAMRFRGCIPANLLPFTADLEIDEPAYRKHLRWLADTKGVTGIVANGHASEVSSLDARGAQAVARHRGG